MAKYIPGCTSLKGMWFRESLFRILSATNTETTSAILLLLKSANLVKFPSQVTEENVIPKFY